MEHKAPKDIQIKPRFILFVSTGVSLLLLASGVANETTPWWMVGILALTVLGLFGSGVSRFKVDAKALTTATMLPNLALAFNHGWPGSEVQAAWGEAGIAAWSPFLARWFSWRGADQLFHFETMLFLGGLTLLGAGVVQSRLLEVVALALLRLFKGSVVPTVIAVTAVFSVASGVLDGVSLIFLLSQTLAILLFLVGADASARRYAVAVATVVTTVCGMWLAYGEPPNLIMKSNVLSPDGATMLDDGFFLRWCLPLAVTSFLVVAANLAFRLRGLRVRDEDIDVLEAHAATFRFLQAERHGEVFTAFEVVEDHRATLGELAPEVERTLAEGHSLGEALVLHGVPAGVRQKLLAVLTHEDLAAPLDKHFQLSVKEHDAPVPQAVLDLISREESRRVAVQRWAIGALVLFTTLLLAHAADHRLPLWVGPFAGAAILFFQLRQHGQVARLALREARHEYSEFLFLVPLFVSVSLITETGFFDMLKELLTQAIGRWGPTPVALGQFYASTVLSAMLDNNVVADFASRALLNLDETLARLFAMSQIAGYALGGCWTHVGSAQSVVAFAFIKRDIDPEYQPIGWIKDITPLILQLLLVLSLEIAAISAWVR